MKIRDRIKELRRVPASELRPNPKNWRTHPKEQADAVRGILAEVGFAGAELARELPDGSLMLIDGHLRAEVAGDSPVPVLVLDVTEAEADKILATFDPLGAMAEADTNKLDALLREVETGSEALAKMLTDLAEENGVLGGGAGEVTEDEVPEPPVEPVTRPGDLWLLGDHRLSCSDSTDAAAVDRLFAGARASLLFTSPPYGQQRDYMKKIDDWEGLMRGVFQHAERVLEPDGQILVNLGLIHREGEWVPYWDAWIAWMREQGWRRFGWYVWDQVSGFPGDFGGRCAPSHEMIFHFNQSKRVAQKHVPTKNPGRVNAGGSMGKNGWQENGRERTTAAMKIPDSVWRVARSRGEANHPAMFPVGLAAIGLETWPGLTYEPFSGSGTTIIAAEQLGRRCFASELAPAYVDVAVTRWEKLTGKQATLEGDGGTFEEVKASRE